jgi:hypothetical protein
MRGIVRNDCRKVTDAEMANGPRRHFVWARAGRQLGCVSVDWIRPGKYRRRVGGHRWTALRSGRGKSRPDGSSDRYPRPQPGHHSPACDACRNRRRPRQCCRKRRNHGASCDDPHPGRRVATRPRRLPAVMAVGTAIPISIYVDGPPASRPAPRPANGPLLPGPPVAWRHR